MKRLFTGALALLLVAGVGYAVGGGSSSAAEPLGEARLIELHAQAATFVGHRDGCRKCHLREHRSWSRTPHAKALEKLEGEDASNPECLSCHTTGMGEASGFTSAEDTPQLAGVTCEACHGAGSVYMDEDTMKDRDASLAAGLQLPDEATCRGCHNENSPTFPGSFDFEAMRDEGVHEIRR